MSVEGAMLGGSFLPEKEFKELMLLLWQEKNQDIIALLDECEQNIISGAIKKAYITWDKFQTIILKNPSTQLLAITHFYNNNGKTQTWSLMDEAEAIEDKGLINVTKVSEDLKKAYCSDILASHLSNLFQTVTGDSMSYDEIVYCYSVKKKQLLESLNDIKYGTKDYKYLNAVYGNKRGRYLNGQVADAYLNHLGGHHWKTLDAFFNSKGDSSMLESIRNKFVKPEEESKGYLNFVKLLLASLNNTGWQTGGDLIVADSSGRVIANIQLKTSGGVGDQIGRISTASLLTNIKLLKQDILTGNAEVIINDFYNLLKTSAQFEELGDAVIQSAYDLAKNTLQLQTEIMI